MSGCIFRKKYLWPVSNSISLGCSRSCHVNVTVSPSHFASSYHALRLAVSIPSHNSQFIFSDGRLLPRFLRSGLHTLPRRFPQPLFWARTGMALSTHAHTCTHPDTQAHALSPFFTWKQDEAANFLHFPFGVPYIV